LLFNNALSYLLMCGSCLIAAVQGIETS
jgi:hypothetical protein